MSKDPKDEGLWDDPLPPTQPPVSTARPPGQPLAPPRTSAPPPVKRLSDFDGGEGEGDSPSDNERIEPHPRLFSDEDADLPTEEGEGLTGFLPPPDDDSATAVPSGPRTRASLPPGPHGFRSKGKVREPREGIEGHRPVFKKPSTQVTAEYTPTPVPVDRLPTGPPASQRGLPPPPVRTTNGSASAKLARFDYVLIGIFLICTHTIAFMLGMKWFN
jgi:hypothetical protein